MSEDSDYISPEDAVEEEALQDQIHQLNARVDRQSRLLTQRARSIKTLTQERDRSTEAFENLVEMRKTGRAHIPKLWTPPKKRAKSGAHHIMGMLLHTDQHLDEFIDPEQMNPSGNEPMNAYDVDIARLRYGTLLDKLAYVREAHEPGAVVDGLAILWGGDTFSGEIHELPQSNARHTVAGKEYWQKFILDWLLSVVDVWEHVSMAAVAGNHPRMTPKVQFKGFTDNSLDWALYSTLQWVVEMNPVLKERVHFLSVPRGFEALFQLYDHNILLNHGYAIKSQGGVGGIYPSMFKNSSRQQNKHAQFGNIVDLIAMGHFHQDILAVDQNVWVGGAMKGYDELAAFYSFLPKPASQGFIWTSPERIIVDWQALEVQDRKVEGW